MEYLAKPTAAEGDMLSGYRIVAPRWAHDALSGEGARKYGGRWNSPGRAVVYLGGSRALAALEMLVHLTTPRSRKKLYKIIKVSVPERLVATYPLGSLPSDWRDSPVPMNTQEIGDDWLHAGGQLAIRMPSVMIPEETNLLLNPNHKDFVKIVSEESVDFSFDQRL